MQDIVLFGSGQVAQVAKFYLDTYSQYRVVGFTVDAAYKSADTFCGLPVVAWEELESHFPPSAVQLLGPLSYQKLNDFRRDRHLEGKARGYSFATFVHPSTHNHAKLGENCFVLENCTLQPFVEIGDGVIIWSATHIGHHCVIGDFCFLSSHVGLGGNVHIGAGSFLGGKVGVETGIRVGTACFLGSASVIKSHVPDESVVPGPQDKPAAYKSSRIKRLRLR